jgi:predicted amidohydrolase YtcJ
MFGPEGPTKADLDKVLPDRPGFFFAIDGHSLWANSKALEMAGVNRATQDPIPGFSYYVRDSDGNPTGYVLEVNAVLALVNAVEPIAPDTMAKLFESWLPKASAAGITSLFDAGVPPIGDDQAAIIGLIPMWRTGARSLSGWLLATRSNPCPSTTWCRSSSLCVTGCHPN